MTYKMTDVCKRLEPLAYDDLARVINGEPDVKVPISYVVFEKLLNGNGWYPDQGTVRKKWIKLVGEGVIEPLASNPDKANLDVKKWAIMAGYLSATYTLSGGEKKIKKNFSADFSREVKV